HGSPTGPGEPERPALPIDQVSSVAAESIASQPASTPDSSPSSTPESRLAEDRPVSAAAEKAQVQRSTATALPATAGDPKLNGYADEVIVHHDRGSLITEQYRSI